MTIKRGEKTLNPLIFLIKAKLLKLQSKLSSREVSFMLKAVSQRHGMAYGKTERRDSFDINQLISNVSSLAE